MKKIIGFFILLSVCCTSWQVQAHQPDLASIILAEQENHKWVLQIRSALTAFEYEIEEHFGEDSYATPEEFQQLVVNYIRDHISIRFNDTHTAELQHGMVKLGHETNVIFQLEGTPEDIRSLAVKNWSFSDIPRQQSVLMVYKAGLEKKQFILNENNGHGIRLEAGPTKFEITGQDQSPARAYFLLLAGPGVLALTVLIFGIQKRTGFRFDASVPGRT